MHSVEKIKEEASSDDQPLQKVMDNVLKQRLQKLLDEKLSNRKSIQSLIRNGILKEENTSSQAKDNLNTDRRDMYRRMSNHSLTEFLCQRPTLNELVNANMVHDLMTWTKVKYNNGIVPNKRNCHQMILDKNQNELYVIGGYNTGSVNSDVLKFEIEKNKWSIPLIGGPIPIQRYSHSVVNIDNNLVMFGGFNADRKWLNDVHTLRIDHGNNIKNSMLLWEKPEITGNVPTPRAAHAAAVMGEKMYVFGGNNGNNVFNDLYCLDTTTMKWSKIKAKSNAPSARSAHTMTAMNDKYLIVFGGINENGKPLNDIWLFDIENRKWIKPKINGTSPEARGGHSAVCIKNNELFIFGGGYNGKILNDLHIFNVSRNQWLRPSDTGIIPTPRTGASIVSNKNNIIYVFGGGNIESDTLYNDLYVLDTGYFSTDHEQLSQLIYASNNNPKRTNKLQNMHEMPPSIDNQVISDGISHITKEVTDMICSVENVIQQQIQRFRQKESEYMMVLRSIEAEREQLTDDINKNISFLKFSVKESMDKLQQNFISKMVTKQVNIDSANNHSHSSEELKSENENKDSDIKSEMKLEENMSETTQNVCSIQERSVGNEISNNSLKWQMAANQHKMSLEYQKQLERFTNSPQNKKKRRKKRRGRRRRKKNKNNELNGANNAGLVTPQNFMINNGSLQNHNMYYQNLYKHPSQYFAYLPPPMIPVQFQCDYQKLNANVMNYNNNYANNVYQLNNS